MRSNFAFTNGGGRVGGGLGLIFLQGGGWGMFFDLLFSSGGGVGKIFSYIHTRITD